MKECPECSMFNQESASKCKYCGAHLGGGTLSGASEPAASSKEDPAKKAEREKEERKKKIITYVGYGVIAAAAIGWLVYSYVKKSKEPPPEEGVAGEVTQEGEAEEAIEGEGEEPVVEEEESIPLGEAVTLESVGITFMPFADAVIEGAGDAAEPDPDLLFSASTDDGVVTMSVRRSDNPDGANPPSGPKAAQMQADYVLSKGRPVIIPGKKKGKSKAGPYVMYEADLGQVLERIYYVFTESDRVDFLFTYPASGEDVTVHEKLIHNIMASMKPVKEAAPAEKPAGPEKPEKPEKASPVPAAEKKPQKAPAKPAPEKKPAAKEAD
jgi:hypothetical protein